MPFKQTDVNMMDVGTQSSLGNITPTSGGYNASQQQDSNTIDIGRFNTAYVNARQDGYLKSKYEFAKELESSGYKVDGLSEYKKKIGEINYEKGKKKSYFSLVGDILDRRYMRTKEQLLRTKSMTEEARKEGSIKEAAKAGIGSSLISATTILGEAVGGAVDIGLLSLGRGITAITPDSVESYLTKKGRDIWDNVKDRQFIKDGIEALAASTTEYEAFKKEHPQQAQLIDNIINISDAIGIGLTSKGVRTGTKEVFKETTETAIENTAKMKEMFDISTSVRNQKEQMTDYLANKVAGLNKETTQAIRENPRYEKFESGELTRRDLGEEVINSLEKERESISELGAAYNDIRTKDVSIDIRDVGENVKSNVFEKYTIEVDSKGNLDFSKSPFAKDVSDQKAIQDAFDIIKGDTIDSNVGLNKRHALSKLSRFGKDVSGDGAAVVREIRNVFNERLHDTVEGLKKLDNEYGPIREKIDLLTRDYYKQGGQLKDSFYSTIANRTNKGKELKFDRLKEIMPDIEAKAGALRAFEDVEKAIGAKTGVYDRIPLIGTSVGLGASVGSAAGPIGTFIGSILGLTAGIKYTDVKVIVDILKKQGKAGKEVIDKIVSGKPLTLNDEAMLKNIASDTGLI